ncbi:MAG: LLM class flavin-dependent oxidoreductase [Alphaproteobacteria bacterium]|nr:LLM class flavin-dependent oxidoreductase [Alphaproteobacteria bacterium]
MEFGVFDHLDRDGQALADYYESRLKLIEAYDRAGFYAYHVAEHHSTPLGMAPSPSVFLSAIAQRTRRLRFGPLVYAMPLHHPLRLAEEICMLDHLSRGRVEMGFGRGSSQHEIAIYGEDPAQAQAIYAEGMEIVLKALAGGSLSYEGRYHSFEDVPLEMESLQKPHPPIWYGVHSTESAERAAVRGYNIASLDTAETTRGFADAFRTRFVENSGAQGKLPKIGISRFITVGETDAEALATARRAYPDWHASFEHLFRFYGGRPNHPRPDTFDPMMERGLAIAGAPDTVAAFLLEQMRVAGADYLIGQFAFGRQAPDECQRTVALFARHVMPALKFADD